MHILQNSTTFCYLHRVFRAIVSVFFHYFHSFPCLIWISLLFLWEIEAPLTTALIPGASNRDNTLCSCHFIEQFTCSSFWLVREGNFWTLFRWQSCREFWVFPLIRNLWQLYHEAVITDIQNFCFLSSCNAQVTSCGVTGKWKMRKWDGGVISRTTWPTEISWGNRVKQFQHCISRTNDSIKGLSEPGVFA